MGEGSVRGALRMPPWRLIRTRWPWVSLAYLATSAGIDAVLLALWVLVLLALPFVGLAIGRLERRRTELLGFDRQPSPHLPVGTPTPAGWVRTRLTEAATWRQVLAVVVDLVAGTIALCVLAVQAMLLAMAVATPFGGVVTFSAPTASFTPDPSMSWWLVPIVVVLLVGAAYLDLVLATGQAVLLRILCGPSESELARGVERLTRSRAVLVEGFEVERRRIERDLHDGAQQELVALGARLAIVELECDALAGRGADVAGLRDAVGASLVQADRAMSSLRRTVRGLHPSVLADRGLHAALDELRGVTAVPLELALDDFPRLGAPAETAAYYLVTEAATNAAKHAHARRLRVTGGWEDDVLTVTADDDGIGGADEGAGTGLRGLRERVETLGGEFEVSSPAGGPTTLRLRLPARPDEEHRATAAGR